MNKDVCKTGTYASAHWQGSSWGNNGTFILCTSSGFQQTELGSFEI